MQTALELTLINPAEVAGRDTYRKFTKTGGEMIQAPYDNIKIRPGFNLRKQLGNLDDLANLIEASGLNVPIVVDVLRDGTIYLADGERRWRAIGILRKRSPELAKRFEYVRAMVNDRNMKESDRTRLMLVSAAGRKELEAIEQAEGFARYMAQKTEENGKPFRAADVARETGWTPMYISNALRLVGITEEEKEMVKVGKVSPTAMQELVKKEPDAEKRLEIIKGAEESGDKFKVKDALKKDPEYGPGSEYSSAGQEEGKDQIIYSTKDDEEGFDKNKPAPAPDADEVFDEENNSIADDEEVQQLGSNPSKPKSRNQIDILTESLIMIKNLDAMVDQVPGAADLIAKIDKNIRHAKDIAVAQAAKV